MAHLVGNCGSTIFFYCGTLHALVNSGTRSVQENFNLITSFIQDSVDKHIPSKTSRSDVCNG